MDVTGTAAGSQVFQTGSAVGYIAPASGFLTPTVPNIVDFLSFLAQTVQISAAALPPTSPWPGYAFGEAMLIVSPLSGSGVLYTLAVYNCATHILYMITPDQTGQTYFATARSNKGFNLVNPSTGLVQASSDESTSVTLKTPDWALHLTASQLDMYKTPWGRYYLNWAQSSGPTVIGLT